ncbi:thiopurine S-methyltransferase [Thiohalorhabdus sp.]|uniref:thiopurine S-methyltransferase n=1 Tax=Thiohalorhabdus sp. TaxID=3094134 RepID=UPI002FC3640F
MDREFWLERWRSRRLGWHREEVNPHLADFWPHMPVAADARVFVPLCGKSVDMKWLAHRGHRVVGVEISDSACREFFHENGLEPRVDRLGTWIRYAAAGVTILCGDFFELDRDLLGPVDAVFDRASLIALPPQMRPDYTAKLRELLPSAPPMLLVTLEYHQHQMNGPPFAVWEDELDRLLGAHYATEHLRDWDVLEDSPRFKEQGLTELHEKVFRLTRP